MQHPLLTPVTIDLSDGLAPDEASVIAVLANRDLVAIRDTHGEAAAQLVGAGVLSNPVPSAEVDQPYGSGAGGTVPAYNLGLGFDIGALVGRAARVAAASARLDAVDLGIAWREWRVAQAARLAVQRLVMLDRREVLVGKEYAFEKEALAILEKAVQKGDASIQDLGIHRSALETLGQLAGDLDRMMAKTRSRLNLLLGLPPKTSLGVVLSPEDTRWQGTNRGRGFRA